MAIRSGSGRNLSRRAGRPPTRLDQPHTGDPDFMVEKTALPVQSPTLAHQPPALPYHSVAGDDDGQPVRPYQLSNLASMEARHMGELLVAARFSHGDVAQETPDFLLGSSHFQMVPKVLREWETARSALEVTLQQSNRRLAAPQLDLRPRSPGSQSLDPSHASRAQSVLHHQRLPIHLGQNQRADGGREGGPGVVRGHGW